MELKIPGLKQEIKAGDVVKKLTSAVGIKPCGGCQQRAEALNQALTLKPRGPAWTVPPEVPEGFAQIAEHTGETITRRMFRNETTGYTMIWDIIDGKYKNARGFCCATMNAKAQTKWEELCLLP